MEKSEMELFFLSFLLILTLFLSISLRLKSARHPRQPRRRPKPMHICKASKKGTPQPMNSSALSSVSVSNENANIISKPRDTSFRCLAQKLFPFYLRPWTRQESICMGGLSLPWPVQPQTLQNSEASCDLREQATVSADSDESDDRLIVATAPFPDLLSGFLSMEMKFSVRSQDLSWHRLTLSSKIHRSVGSQDLSRELLRGEEKFIKVAITKGGGKTLIQSEETLPMMSCRWNNILNEVSKVTPSSSEAVAIFITTRDDGFSDTKSREILKNASKTLLNVDSSDTNVVVNMKISVCHPTRNGLNKIDHSTPSPPTADLLSYYIIKHD
ncbi:uncharacterized protein J3R85_005519 [Psidium guajava]|nr:uncharacterized protein J3R85_005519 [Psidium guajava]